jgi:uroporphyrinogen-III decarboxylase
MPNTVIQGQLHPFTFMRNERENILNELFRDFEQAKKRKGLLFATAGSVSNGSRLETFRLVMAAIQRYCRYNQ